MSRAKIDIDDLCNEIIELGVSKQQEIIQLIDKYLADTEIDTLTALCACTRRPFKKTNRLDATVLHLVCELGFTDVFDHIMLLCSNPIFLNRRMDDGSTALLLANMSRGRKSETQVLHMTKTLVKNGASMFLYRDRVLATPFYIACEFGHLESASFLLQAMLQKYPQNFDYVVYRQCRFRYTVLHASVSNGSHSDVCRWLTSPECKMLWPDNDLGKFVNYTTLVSGENALHTALLADSINMDNVRRLIECGATIDSGFLEKLLSLVQVRRAKGKSGQQDFGNETVLIEYLCDLGFAEHTTVLVLLSWFGSRCSFPEADMLASVIRKRIAGHHRSFTPKCVEKCKSHLVVAAKTDMPEIYSTAVLLDWYPYDPQVLDVMISFPCFPTEVIMHYIRRYAVCVHSFDVFPKTLKTVLEDENVTVWQALMTFLGCQHRHPNEIIFEVADLITLNYSYNDLTVRFLYTVWRKAKGVIDIQHLLDQCSDGIASSLYLSLRTEFPTLETNAFSNQRRDRLLFTVIWHGNMTPSQIVTRMFITGKNAYLTKHMVRLMVMIYNIRHLLREKGHGQRLILGARSAVATATPSAPLQPLPLFASKLIVAFLYLGTIVDMSPICPLV